MRIKTWIFLLLSLVFTARAAVIPIKITDFPRTNTIPAQALFLIAITNSVENTNYGFSYTNLFRQITSAIPVVINSFTNGSNFFTVGGYWTNIGGLVQLLGGSTNTAKFSTNNNRGLLIGDTNIATTWFGWPSDGLSYLSVYDGSTGHLINRWIHGVLQPSTTNGSYATVTSQTGVNPTLTEAFVVLTNGVIASEFDINMQRTGAYLLLGGNVNEGFVGIQHGAQVSTPIGPNLIRAKWGGTDRWFLSTNGGVSFFGSATNYGVAYNKSNMIVSGTTLLQSTLAVNGAALFLNGLGSLGITNTIGFQTLGSIVLGDDPSDLTVSSNLFRQYGPMHIHDQLFFQNVGMTPGELIYLTSPGRVAATVPGVNSTHASYLLGLTEPISTSLARAVTNITGTGGILVTSNSGNYNIDGSGISGGGAGGSSMWTNQATVVRLIAGSTNFVGGGLLNGIATNTYSTIAGGYNNFITNNSSFSAIGGGTTNTIRTNSPFSTIAGGNQNHVDESAQYSTIAGGNGNSVSFDAYASTIGGGTGNRSAFLHGTVAGGSGNLAGATNAFVGGGSANSAIGANSVIAGGGNNNITGGASYPYMTIGGGAGHSMIQAAYGTIAGGAGNIINAGAESSVIAGGSSNVVQSGVGVNASPNNFIGGGYSNTVVYPSAYSIIVGGLQNTILSGADRSIIGGGYLNSLQADMSVIAGGRQNLIETNATNSAISGGYLNKIWTNSPLSAIGGGEGNNVGDGANNATLQTHHSFIGGGRDNNAVSPYSFIGGGQANVVRGDSTALGWQVIGGGRGNDIGADDGAVSLTFSASFTTIGGGDANNIQYGAEGATIGGGMANKIRIQNTNAVIAGGKGNIIHTGPYSAILGGQNNQIGDLGAGFSGDHSFIIGSGILVTNNYFIGLGFTNNSMIGIDKTNLHLIGNMSIVVTNNAVNGAVWTSDVNGKGAWVAGGGGGGGGSSGYLTVTTNASKMWGDRIESDGTNWTQVAGPGRWVIDEEFGGTSSSVNTAENGSYPWNVNNIGTGATLPVRIKSIGGSEHGYIAVRLTNSLSGKALSLGESTVLTNSEYFCTFRWMVSTTNKTTITNIFQGGIAGVTSGLDPANGVYIGGSTNGSNTIVCVTARNSSKTYTYPSIGYEPLTWYTSGFYIDRFATNVVFYHGTNAAYLSPIATNSTTIPNGAFVNLSPYLMTMSVLTNTTVGDTTNYFGSFKLWQRPFDQ